MASSILYFNEKMKDEEERAPQNPIFNSVVKIVKHCSWEKGVLKYTCKKEIIIGNLKVEKMLEYCKTHTVIDYCIRWLETTIKLKQGYCDEL